MNQLVMTSINPPTEAVKKYAAMKDWHVIMVGDRKTPEGWRHENVSYLPPEDQEKLPFKLISKHPWNMPARANIGFLKAMESDPPFITQSDDDNIPKPEWKILPFNGLYPTVSHSGFINVYKYFTDEFVWPRGLPLDKILENTKPEEKENVGRVGIWQHLADKDTDVDAIYRLTNGKEIFFKKRPPLVLEEGTMSPFNCQSTTFSKAAFPLLYLPVTITPRASDIVRSLVAQPIMWQYGYRLGFTDPIVIQERNPHNYLKDFKDEVLIYLHSETIINKAKEGIRKDATMLQNLLFAYQNLVKENLIPKAEIAPLKAWIKDVEKLTESR